jgi:hypothetical protein
MTISGEDIKNWASAITAQSELKLAHFGERHATGPSRATMHIALENDHREYHVWILPELNMILLDVFQKSSNTDEQLFRGEITQRSFERIAEILAPPKPIDRRVLEHGYVFEGDIVKSCVSGTGASSLN